MKLLGFIVLSLCLSVLPLSLSAEENLSVNINTADAAVLSELLTGIGEVKAVAIVAYREQNGAFESIDQITEVKGIGESLIEKNRQRIRLE